MGPKTWTCFVAPVAERCRIAVKMRVGPTLSLSGRPKSKTLSDAYRNKLEELVPNDPEKRPWGS